MLNNIILFANEACNAFYASREECIACSLGGLVKKKVLLVNKIGRNVKVFPSGGANPAPPFTRLISSQFDWLTLKEETFAERNLRDFREFWAISRKLFPRKVSFRESFFL